MILLSLKERGDRRKDGKPLTRARFSRLTLKRLCQRQTITQPWIDRVNEPLMAAGWVLIDAGTTYGAVKVNVVENWPRASSKNLRSILDQVKSGTFNFDRHGKLLSKAAWETTTHLRGRNTNTLDVEKRSR
jgi:hypothetical protein